MIVDSDTAFSALVERSMASSGFKVHVVKDLSSGLDRIVDLRPQIVVAAVDLPERAGFTICNRTKGLVKGARVVLATSTIPWPEMETHQKLKVHADLYLDKRRLSEAEVSRQLAGLLRASPIPSERAENTRGVQSDNRTLDAGPEREQSEAAQGGPAPKAVPAAESIDAEAFLAELDSAAAAAEPEIGAATETDRDERVVRLQREIEDVRRSAHSSPFSKDFFDLRDRLSEKEREAARLKQELEGRERTITALRRKALHVLSPLLATVREKSNAATELAARLKATEAIQEEERAALETAHQEALGRKEAEYRLALEQARLQLETLERRMAQQLEQSRATLDTTLAEVAAQHLDALRASEHRHLADVVELETRLNRERGQEALAIRAEWEQRLARAQTEAEETEAALRKAHAAETAALDAAQAQKLGDQSAAHRDELQSLRARLQQHLEELQLLHQSRLAETQASHTETRRRLEEEQRLVVHALESRAQTEKAHALEALKAEWEQKLEASRREHARALDALRAQHDDAIAGLRVAHREALADKEGELQAALRHAAEERDLLRASLQRGEQATSQRYEARIAELQAAQAEARKQATENQLAAIKIIEESQAEKDRATALAAESASALEKAREEQASALAGLRRKHGEEVAALQSAVEEARARAAEAREALALVSRELAEQKQATAQLENDLRSRYDTEIPELQGKLRRQAEQEMRSLLSATESRLKLEQERATSSLREVHEKALAQRDAEHRAALVRAGDELQQAQAAAESRLSALQAELAQARAELQHHAKKQHALAALQRSQEEALAQRDREYRAALQRASDELEAVRSSLEQKEKEWQRRAEERLQQAIAQSRRQADQAQAAAVAAVEARFRSGTQKEAAAQRSEWEAALERARADGAAALANQQTRHTQELERLRAMHTEAAARVSEELTAARSALQERDGELQQVRQRYEASLAELQASYTDARRQANQDQLAAVRALEAAQADHEHAMGALEAEWARKITAEKRGDEEEIAALRAALQQEQTKTQQLQVRVLELQSLEGETKKQAALEAKLAALRTTESQARKQIAGLEARVTELQSSEAQARRRVSLLEADQAAAAQELTAMRFKNDNAKLALQKAREEQAQAFAELQARHEAAVAVLEGAQQDVLAKKENELQLLRLAVEELAELRATIEQLRRRHPDIFKEVLTRQPPEAERQRNRTAPR